MIKYHLLPMLVLAALNGCATSHYIETKQNSLAFFLKMPKAKSVSFASSVDNYNLRPAHQISPGVWQVRMSQSSELSYFYVVDGIVYLPDCRFKETDDFGSENCLYIP